MLCFHFDKWSCVVARLEGDVWGWGPFAVFSNRIRLHRTKCNADGPLHVLCSPQLLDFKEKRKKKKAIEFSFNFCF